MTTKQLHFKWTISRGRDTYGYNICTLLVEGEKVGKTCGGGYDMQGTVLGQWLTDHYQQQLISLFNNDLTALASDPNAHSYDKKGIKVRFGYPIPTSKGHERYYGANLYEEGGKFRVLLDGACGFDSIKRIAEAIGITFKWNPESNRYKNHTYYTAFINPIESTYSDSRGQGIEY